MQENTFLKNHLIYREKYVIICKLASTIASEIYKAYDIYAEITVAIKVIRFEKLFLQNDLDFYERIQQIQNENIIKVYDIIYDDDLKRDVIIYEYANNKKQLIKNERLTEKESINLIKQILNAFKILLEFGVYHDDFSMKKILFHNDKIKINFSHNQLVYSGRMQYSQNVQQQDIFYQLKNFIEDAGNEIEYDFYAVGLIFFHFLFGFYPKNIQNIVDEIHKHGQEISKESKNVLLAIFTNKIDLNELIDQPFFNQINEIEELDQKQLKNKLEILKNENYQLKVVLEIQRAFNLIIQYDYGTPVLQNILIKQDQFEIFHDEVLGQGGFGTVYKGLLNKKIEVAVKCMEISYEDAKSIMDEIITMNSLQNEYLVKMYGISFGLLQNGTVQVQILMELMKQDIKQLIFNSSTKVRHNQKVKLCEDILKGLHYLSEKKIVHCDMKLMNVLVDQKGVAKITDFGLSKCLSSGNTKKTTNITGFSERYTPKEYLESNIVSSKCDIWAFGILVYEIFKEKQAWQGLSGPQVIAKVLSQQNFFILNEKTHDQRVDELIQLCLNYDYEKRPTANELLKIVNSLLREEEQS